MILYLLTIVILLLLAPLLLSFIKSLKMILLFKRPASIFQGYRNFSKLLTKETIISKETSAITTGAMMDPSSMPNLNHNLFGRVNTLGVTKANNKKTTDTINAQIRRPSELTKGYKPTIKNTIENTIPKDFSEDCSVGM